MTEINGFTLTQLVIRNSSLSATAYLVAIIIADRYDQRKGYSAISSRRIAQTAGLSLRTITSALTELEQSGEWNASKAKGSTSKYYPVLEKLVIAQDKKAKAKDEPVASADPENEELKPETHDDVAQEPSNPPKSSKPKKTDTEDKVVSTGVSYPELSEDTDPCLNGLPLIDDKASTGDIPDVVRPPALSSPLALAVRLHKRVDISTRINRKDFTVPKLTALIEALHRDYPLEAIDILLWIQCENRQPLNQKFLGIVLKKCVVNGEIVLPERWHEDKADPAFEVAREVYTVFSQRHALHIKEYASYL